MTLHMGVPGPVMCEPNGSMVIQSSMSNVAFCADANPHSKTSIAEIEANLAVNSFFIETSREAIC